MKKSSVIISAAINLVLNRIQINSGFAGSGHHNTLLETASTDDYRQVEKLRSKHRSAKERAKLSTKGKSSYGPNRR